MIGLRFVADRGQDTTWDGIVLAHAIIWTAIELNYCLISATIPVLGPFISNLSTSFGVTQDSSGTGYGDRSVNECQGRGGTGTFELMPVRATCKRKRHRTLDFPENTGQGTYTSDVQGNGGSDAPQSERKSHADDGLSVESNDSQKLIIKKEVTWHVV